MPRLSGHGLGVDLPRGWDGAISKRTDSRALPVLHAASMPLPAERADSGGGVVERLGWGDVFLCLLEHDRAGIDTAVFANQGVPTPLSPDLFAPRALQGMRPVQSGGQWFFSLHGRAFCLFVVVGEHRRRHRLVPPVARVLESLEVTPADQMS